MSITVAMTLYCNAKTRSGGVCRLRAGHGTDHVGVGRCRRHGGNTRTHRQRAAREAAFEFAARALGSEAALAPTEGLLLSVRLAGGAVMYWRLRLLAEGEQQTEATREGFRQAVADLNRYSKTAVDDGVAEERVRIAEQWADQITLVCEEGLAALVDAGVVIDHAQRTAYAEGVREGLERLEGEAAEASIVRDGHGLGSHSVGPRTRPSRHLRRTEVT